MHKSLGHIVHLISGDQWAGAEVMVGHLLTQLARQTDIELTAICLNEGQLSEVLRSADVEVCVVPEESLAFPRIAMAALGTLKGRPAHVLHSHRYKEHLLGTAMAAFLGSRLVATVHGLPEPSRTRQPGFALQHRIADRLLRHRFDEVVAVSDALRTALIAQRGLAASKIRVVPNGIPIVAEHVIQLPRPEVRHIGSVGRLVPVKRFDLFLEMAAAIRRVRPEMRFSILGAGPDEALLKSRAEGLGLSAHFSIEPPVQEPWRYYGSLDLYVNTSESEGLPLSILEAMTMCIPVVASAVGGIPEVITNGVDGFLIDSSTAGDYAARCLQLIADRDERARVGIRARDRVGTSYSAHEMAARYCQMYSELTGGGASSGGPSS